MVIRISKNRFKNVGMLTNDLIVAMGLLAMVVLPLSFSFWNEHRLAKSYYCRSVAMEIVDGEMEKLVAGEWRQYKNGVQPYVVKSEAAKNLSGEFTLEMKDGLARLEWKASGKSKGGHVVREGRVR